MRSESPAAVHSRVMSDRRRSLLLAATLFALTLALFLQTATFEFVNYDDHRYVYQNPRVLAGLSADNLRWAFTTFEFSNWHPLTWLSLMLDADLHGDRAGGYHLTNVIVHAVNAALLMLLLSGMTGAAWRSALVAALFAAHPLHVESVAWVSERKDVLSTFFSLLAILAYVRYTCAGKNAGSGEGGPGLAVTITSKGSAGLTAFCLMIGLFALSLMCKPMFVTLPALLLVLDWWPLRRVRAVSDWPRLIVEKLPLLAMSIASSIVTMLAQRGGGAVRDFHHAPLDRRAANAVIAYGEYLWQNVWPADLAVFYPYPATIETLRVVLAVCAMIAITIACIVAARRNYRAPLVGWLWYLGTLTPVIGFVQVGAQAHADRYTYVPLIGVFIMVAWSLPAAPHLKRWSVIAATTVLLALAAVCWVQIGYWRDSATLASRALAVTKNNATAHVLMANALVDEKQFDAAIAHLEEATRIDPLSPQAWHNLGFAYAQAGRIDDAIAAYQQAIVRRPDFAENYYNVGVLLQRQNRTVEARAVLQRAADAAAAAGDDLLHNQANERLNATSMPDGR